MDERIEQAYRIEEVENRHNELQRQHRHRRRIERMELLHAAEAQRESWSVGDSVSRRDLSPERLGRLRGPVWAAATARRQAGAQNVRHLARRPCCILAFVIAPSWRWRNDQHLAELQPEIAAALDRRGRYAAVCGEGGHVRLWWRPKKVPTGQGL